MDPMITRDYAFKKWLSVLRDPKSKKHVGSLESLHDSNTRCCLGHACHALHSNKTIFEDKVCYGAEKEYTFLPQKIAKLLNITPDGEFATPIHISRDYSNIDSDENVDEDINYLPTSIGYNDLVSLNDDTILSPAEIANIIEEQYKNKNFYGIDDER